MAVRQRKRIPEAISTDVYVTLERLIGEWREDPDRLAVALTAYELGGWWWWYFAEREHDRFRAALRGRDRRLLRHRAEGLLIACEALATDVEFARLHRVREESAVIECRELPIEERIAKLREMEATRA